MKNPYLHEADIAVMPEPPKPEPCQACESPVRRSHVITAITVMVDAAPHAKGTYYYENDEGLILEDRTGSVREYKYRRHRCHP